MSASRDIGRYRSLQLIGDATSPSAAADACAVDDDGAVVEVVSPISGDVRAVLIRGISSPQELAAVTDTVDPRLDRILILESAAAVWQLPDLLRSDDRVTQLGLDEAAYCSDCRIPPDPDVDGCALARSRTVVEATAANVCPLASVPPWDFDDADLAHLLAVRRQCGFKGMFGRGTTWIDNANDAFVPPAEQVAFAQRVRAAFLEAEQAGRAAVELDGHMIDIAAVRWAERLLAWAEGSR